MIVFKYYRIIKISIAEVPSPWEQLATNDQLKITVRSKSVTLDFTFLKIYFNFTLEVLLLFTKIEGFLGDLLKYS